MKRSLGVWAPAAHCGDIRSSPQVRDHQVRERSRHRKTATADVSLPFCKKRIEGKGVGGGSSATHEAVKTGVYETAPGKTRPSLREGWS